MKAGCADRLKLPLGSWGPLSLLRSGPDTIWEENNNISPGKPDKILKNFSGSISKWIPGQGQGMLRSRSSPTMDLPPNQAASDNSTEDFSRPDGVWKDEGSIGSHLRCKSVLIICACILLFNLVLVLCLHGRTVIEANVRDKDILTQINSPDDLPNNFEKSKELHVVRSDSHIVRSDSHIVAKSKKTPSDSSRNPLHKGCRSGHIQGFSPVCDIQGCLRKLYVDPALRMSLPRPEPFDPTLRAEINYIPGKMNSIHMNLVTILTDMQWHYNIYGSVGEIGAHVGKFASVLAFNYHQEGGERLFVSDSFSRSLGGLTKSPVVQFDVFHETMIHKGFTFNSQDPNQKRVYVHDGPHTDLSRHLLLDWDLPQFRMLSIGSMNNHVSFLQIMETATCILRDGGILAIDGIHQEHTRRIVLSSISKYFQTYGVSAITPFLAAKDKLYLCTTNWKDLFTRYLIQRQDILRALAIRAVTDSEFGYQFTYFKIGV